MQVQVLSTIVKGKIVVPASKSDAQRAIIAASLATGTSKIANCGTSDDVLHVIKAVELLGAKVESPDTNSYLISGGKWVNSKELNVGESGLAIRLLTPIVATKNDRILLNGKGSLLKRPLHFFEENLSAMNVEVKSTNGFLPIEIQGPLKGGTHSIDGSQSSQYISGLLMALPLAEDASDLTVGNLASKPYVQMTLNTLSKFGIHIENEKLEHFLIAGKQTYLPCDYLVEGDWSAASYWLVAAALGADVTIAGLSMASLQADKKMLDALISAGCALQFSDEGITVKGNEKKAFQFDATHCPDLFPALVSFAAFCPGVSVISGVKRLKNKESDRGLALKTEFEKLGVLIELQEDEMYIHGKSAIEGGEVFSHNDHRIAMCLAIVGLYSKNGIRIDNADAVAKSYPDFWKDLEELTC